VVETVDRIQGKERDAIVASYTVADAEFAQAEGEFLRTRGLWPLWRSRRDTLWARRLSRLFREYLAKRFVGP
jgi:hypothetical protein